MMSIMTGIIAAVILEFMEKLYMMIYSRSTKRISLNHKFNVKRYRGVCNIIADMIIIASLVVAYCFYFLLCLVYKNGSLLNVVGLIVYFAIMVATMCLVPAVLRDAVHKIVYKDDSSDGDLANEIISVGFKVINSVFIVLIYVFFIVSYILVTETNLNFNYLVVVLVIIKLIIDAIIIGMVSLRDKVDIHTIENGQKLELEFSSGKRVIEENEVVITLDENNFIILNTETKKSEPYKNGDIVGVHINKN